MARLKNWILNLAPARAGIFCVSAALQVVFSTVIFVSANPTGEQVVSGGATFNREGNTLTINTSDRVIINWQDFSINSGEMTKFLQPGSDSAALNRVISGNPSSLLGTLSANGQIYLINPNGILVGPNAQINTAAFIASTLDLDNDEFMKGGDQRFFGDAASKIVNLGTISAQGGDVFLISREIENAGVINAEKGSVNLAAGKEVLLTQKGDQRVFVKVGSDGAPGSVQNGIVNKGLIKSVQANIEAQGNIYAYAINNSGAINATGVENKDGRVMLTATGGNIVNSGEIVAERNGFGLIRAQNAELASGSSIKATAGNNGGQITVQSAGKTTASGSVVATGTASGKGGNVSLLGHEVTAKNLTVNASGGTGGGQILVGGDKQGKNASVQNAQKTFIEKDVTLNADATVQGAGGKVIVWADDRTDFYGRISARGGETGGNGGFAEVSGKETLVYRGFADLRAPKGSTGNLLLDPKNIIIIGSPTQPIDPIVGNSLFTDNPSLDATFLTSDIVTALYGANLTLQANNDISVVNTIDATGNALDGNLTFQAGRSILIGTTAAANIRLRGSFSATANDAGAVAAQRDAGAAAFTMFAGSTIDTSAGPNAAGRAITITMGTGAGGGQTSGDITIGSLNAGGALTDGTVTINNNGSTQGSDILRVNSDSLVTANTAIFNAGSALNTSGSVGTVAAPIRVSLTTNGVAGYAQADGFHVESPTGDLYVNAVTASNTGAINLFSTFSAARLYVVGAVGDTNVSGNVRLRADNMFFSNRVSSSTRINLETANNIPIEIGSTNSALGRLTFNTSDFTNVFAPTLQVGNSNATDLSVLESFSLSNQVSTLRLVSGGNLSAGGALITVTNLAVEANGTVTLDSLSGGNIDVQRFAASITGGNSIGVKNASTNMFVTNVDGIAGVRTVNGSITIAQKSGNLAIADSTPDPSVFDVDAGTGSLSIGSGGGTNDFLIFDTGSRVRGNSIGASGGNVIFNTNSLVQTVTGGTISADLMDVNTGAQIVGTSSTSDILIKTVTGGGSVLAIADNSGINGGYTLVPTVTIVPIDGNGSGFSLNYTTYSTGGATFGLMFGIEGPGSGYTEAPSITVSPPQSAGSVGAAVIVTLLSEGRAINIGNKAAGQLGFTQAELNRFSVGNLRIGDTTSGQIRVTDNITITSQNQLSLKTRADITGSGTITIQTLNLFATRGIALTGNNDVDTMTADTRRNGVTFNDIDGFNVGASGLNSGGNVRLSALGNIGLVGGINSTGGSVANGTVTILASGGEFSSSGGGTVNAGSSTALIESRTISLGAAVTANGGIIIRPDLDSVNIAINDAASTYNVSKTAMTLLNSSGGVTIGRDTGTASVNIGSLGAIDASTANYNLTLLGGSLNVNGAISLGNKSFTAGANAMNIGAQITANGGIALRPNSDTVTIGINDATGALSLDASEMRNLSSSGYVTIGRGTSTANYNIGSAGSINLSTNNYSLTLQGLSNSLAFNFSGNDTMTMGSNTTFVINTYGTVTSPGNATADVTIGGASGTLVLSNTLSTTINSSVSRLTAANAGGAIDLTNNASLEITGNVRSTDNPISISANGTLLMTNSNGRINAGTSTVSLSADAINLNQLVTGTTSISISPRTAATGISLNDAASGLLISSNTLSRLSTTSVILGRTDGTGNINIGSAGSLNMTALPADVTIQSGTGNINFNFSAGNTLQIAADRTLTLATAGNIASPGASAADVTIAGGGGTGTLNVNGGNVSLTGSVDRFGTSTVNASLTYTNAGDLAVTGPVSSGAGAIQVSLASSSGRVLVNNTISSAGGAVALSGANGTVLSGAGTLINTAGGAFSVNADSDANGTGLYQQLGTTVVNTAGGAVSIVSGTGVSFAAGTGINSGAADITLNSSTGPINLGTLTSGNYLVVGTDLTGLATTGAIVFGDRTQNKQILASGFNVGANNVRMATAGTIENVAGTAVTTTGTITLDAAGGIGTNGSLLVDAPGLAILTEGPVVDVVDAANLASLVVRTDGTVTNQNVVAGNLAAYNVSENITTQDTVINAVTATTPMNFVYSNTVGNVTFGAVDLTATGNLSLFTTKTATQGAGAITVNNVNVIAGAGTDFILNNAANVINGSISATGTGGNLRDVTLVDSTPLDMGTVTINRNLTVQGADITQSGVLTVGGTATFTANTGQDIILNNVGNSITGAVTFIGNGGNLNNLSFANTQSIANGPMTLAGNLTLNSTAGTVSVAATTVGGNLSLTGTSVSQTGALAVTGNSTITAANGQSITLTDAGNNFAGTVDFVAASGTLQNVSIRDTSTLDLAALTLNGNLNVDAFNITQTGPLAITGTTTVTAAAGQDITLNDAGNVFTGALTFAGSGGQLNNVTLLNNGAVSLGGVDLLGNLGVTAQTITSSGALLVDGNSLFTVTAPNSDLLFAGSANDFAGMVTFATAGAGTIRDIGFRNINAGATTPVLPAGLRNLALAFDALAYDLDGSLPVITGNLAITAGGGNITQSATLNLPGNLTLNSGVNDIIITDPANVVVGSVSLIGANVTYAQATDINLGMSSSPGTVDLTTGGGITQSSSLTAGTLTATTGGPIALTGSGNQISSLGTIDRGGAFTLNNVSSLAVNAPLTAGTVNNNVTISVSGGNLTLNAPIAGQNISLNSQGFYNNSGSSALQTSGGTWQIFVPDPSNVQFGGLSSGATFVFGSTSASGQSGNVIIFGQGGNVGSSLLVNPSSATDLSAGLFVLNPWYDSTYPRNQINYGDAFFNLYTVVPVYAGGFTRDFQNFTSLSGFNPNNYMAFYSSFFYDPDYTYGYY